MATISVTAKPESEPLTKGEVKLHLGIDGTEYDSRLDQLIQAARETIERTTNRRLIEQTLTIYDDIWPRGKSLKLPVAPISAVGSVKYYDSNDVLQTLASSKYVTDLVNEPGRIVLIDSELWPDLYIGRPNAIEVSVTAGYGNSGADVPGGINTAMLFMIEKAFDRPDDQYLKALDRVLTNELSPYNLHRFL